VLERLTAFQHLRSLDIRGRGVTDLGLVHLARHECLEKLWLANTDATDAGMASLAVLPKLKYPVLRGTRISVLSLDQLTTIQTLEELDLSATRVTTVGAEVLFSEASELSSQHAGVVRRRQSLSTNDPD
jgi:hypothetical protein